MTKSRLNIWANTLWHVREHKILPHQLFWHTTILGKCRKVEAFLTQGGYSFVPKCCHTGTNKVSKIHPEILKQLGSRHLQHCELVWLFPWQGPCLNLNHLIKACDYIQQQPRSPHNSDEADFIAASKCSVTSEFHRNTACWSQRHGLPLLPP